MTNVIVAFARAEDARSIRHILMRSGFRVVAVCTSGAQALSCLEGLSRGILVSGCRFPDMAYPEVFECLPPGFEMLLVSSPSHWGSDIPKRLVCLPMPLKVHDLVSTLEMMAQAQESCFGKRMEKPRMRNKEEETCIREAKAVLKGRNGMTEEEAHRYIQKCSMDSGTNMVETAQMIISLANG